MLQPRGALGASVKKKKLNKGPLKHSGTSILSGPTQLTLE